MNFDNFERVGENDLVIIGSIIGDDFVVLLDLFIFSGELFMNEIVDG